MAISFSSHCDTNETREAKWMAIAGIKKKTTQNYISEFAPFVIYLQGNPVEG